MPYRDDNPDHGRRRLLTLGAAAATAPFLGWGPLRAETADLVPLTSIPEKLKGSGELRIAAYGGTD